MDKEIQMLQERIAKLEFQNDQLATELSYLDALLRRIGFSEGLSSVKSAAYELNSAHEHLYEDGLPDEPPGLED
jgi:hypothetical protein